MSCSGIRKTNVGENTVPMKGNMLNDFTLVRSEKWGPSCGITYAIHCAERKFFYFTDYGAEIDEKSVFGAIHKLVSHKIRLHPQSQFVSTLKWRFYVIPNWNNSFLSLHVQMWKIFFEKNWNMHSLGQHFRFKM